MPQAGQEQCERGPKAHPPPPTPPQSQVSQQCHFLGPSSFRPGWCMSFDLSHFHALVPGSAMSHYVLPFDFCFLCSLPRNSHLSSLPTQQMLIWYLSSFRNPCSLLLSWLSVSLPWVSWDLCRPRSASPGYFFFFLPVGIVVLRPISPFIENFSSFFSRLPLLFPFACPRPYLPPPSLKTREFRHILDLTRKLVSLPTREVNEVKI